MFKSKRAPFATFCHLLFQMNVQLLSGHAASVNCVDLRDFLCASGSDDSSSRLWDLRSAKCIRALKFFNDAVTAIHFVSDHTLAAASGNCLYLSDLRRADIILKTHEFKTPEEACCSDDINQLISHEDRLYAADDSGELSCYSIQNQQLQLVDRAQIHSNICSDAAILPNNPSYILTGGLDQEVKLVKNASPFAIAGTCSVASSSSSSGTNPPFVYALSMHPIDRKCAVAALGSGDLALLHVEPQELDHKQRLAQQLQQRRAQQRGGRAPTVKPSVEVLSTLQIHRAAVCDVLVIGYPRDSVHFCFCSEFSRFSQGDCLISCGTDRTLAFWDWSRISSQESRDDSWAVNLSASFSAAEQETMHTQYIRGRIELVNKPNSIRTGHHTPQVVIADTSNDLSILSLR